MDIRLVDIHSHLNLPPLSEDNEAVLARMRELGVVTITVGTGIGTSRDAVRIAEENPDLCWATVGLHPCHVLDGDAAGSGADSHPGSGHDPESAREVFVDHADEFRRLAAHPKVVAIGETGLDYFHDDTTEMRATQESVFRAHIELALGAGKPLMLHVRATKGSDDAYYDALRILAEYRTGAKGSEGAEDKNAAPNGALRANFHFFSGSVECMRAIVAAGYTVSVDGPITFTDQYDEMIRACPLGSLMVETDSPFAAPKPYRGKPCEPWMVVEVANRIAEIKGLDREEVFAQLRANTRRCFGI